MRISRSVLLLALAGLCPAAAQSADTWDLKQDLIRELEWERQRATQLAEAIPADKYSWRPAEGVRSIGETMLHMTQNVHYLLSMTGVPMPEGITNDLEALDHKLAVECEHKSALESLFKTMLHLLMTGQVRVKDWDLPEAQEGGFVPGG